MTAPRDPIVVADEHWKQMGCDTGWHFRASLSIYRADDLIRERDDTALRPHHLTRAKHEALAIVYFSRAGELPLGKLGERLLVHPTSVTSTVDALEAAGLVRRVSHPTRPPRHAGAHHGEGPPGDAGLLHPDRRPPLRPRCAQRRRCGPPVRHPDPGPRRRRRPQAGERRQRCTGRSDRGPDPRRRAQLAARGLGGRTVVPGRGVDLPGRRADPPEQRGHAEPAAADRRPPRGARRHLLLAGRRAGDGQAERAPPRAPDERHQHGRHAAAPGVRAPGPAPDRSTGDAGPDHAEGAAGHRGLGARDGRAGCGVGVLSDAQARATFQLLAKVRLPP